MAPTHGSATPDPDNRPPGAARHLLRRAARPDPDGVITHVDPANAGWDWTTCTVYRLVPGQVVTCGADTLERLVLVLEGYAAVTAGEPALPRVGYNRRRPPTGRNDAERLPSCVSWF